MWNGGLIKFLFIQSSEGREILFVIREDGKRRRKSSVPPHPRILLEALFTHPLHPSLHRTWKEWFLCEMSGTTFSFFFTRAKEKERIIKTRRRRNFIIQARERLDGGDGDVNETQTAQNTKAKSTLWLNRQKKSAHKTLSEVFDIGRHSHTHTQRREKNREYAAAAVGL